MEVLAPLTFDETVVLQILSAGGGPLAPIGRWKNPILSLEKRGFLKRTDAFNFEITPAGLAVVDMDVQESDSAVAKTLSSTRGVE